MTTPSALLKVMIDSVRKAALFEKIEQLPPAPLTGVEHEIVNL